MAPHPTSGLITQSPRRNVRARGLLAAAGPSRRRARPAGARRAGRGIPPRARAAELPASSLTPEPSRRRPDPFPDKGLWHHCRGEPGNALNARISQTFAFVAAAVPRRQSRWRHSASSLGRPRRRRGARFPATALRPEGPCGARVWRCRDCPGTGSRPGGSLAAGFVALRKSASSVSGEQSDRQVSAGASRPCCP